MFVPEVQEKSYWGGNMGPGFLWSFQIHVYQYMNFQPSLVSSSASKAPGFYGLPTERYTLGRLVTVFQVLEAKAIKTLMLSLEGIIRSNGEAPK